MVAGNWLNYDGLYLQYGTQKAVPELGGDYSVYGSTRELEVMISLGATVFGQPTGNVATAALPTLFQGTIASQTVASNTGIVSYTTLFPLQPTAPIGMSTTGIFTASAGAANGILNIINPQMFIEQIELTTLVAANNSTNSSTGLTGIGLVIPVSNQTSSVTAPSWAQVTPNAGLQLMQAVTNAEMTPSATVPSKWVFWPGLAGGSTQMAVAEFKTPATSTTTYPTAGVWLGNVPLTTLSETYLPGSLPNNAYISAIVSTGGTPGAVNTGYTGANEGGLLKLRVRYYWYGSINDATAI
jgi:hypothetical protein